VYIQQKFGIIMTEFRKAHVRAFVYNSYHVYCKKMHAYALYGI